MGMTPHSMNKRFPSPRFFALWLILGLALPNPAFAMRVQAGLESDTKELLRNALQDPKSAASGVEEVPVENWDISRLPTRMINGERFIQIPSSQDLAFSPAARQALETLSEPDNVLRFRMGADSNLLTLYFGHGKVETVEMEWWEEGRSTFFPGGDSFAYPQPGQPVLKIGIGSNPGSGYQRSMKVFEADPDVSPVHLEVDLSSDGGIVLRDRSSTGLFLPARVIQTLQAAMAAGAEQRDQPLLGPEAGALVSQLQQYTASMLARLRPQVEAGKVVSIEVAGQAVDATGSADEVMARIKAALADRLIGNIALVDGALEITLAPIPQQVSERPDDLSQLDSRLRPPQNPREGPSAAGAEQGKTVWTVDDVLDLSKFKGVIDDRLQQLLSLDKEDPRYSRLAKPIFLDTLIYVGKTPEDTLYMKSTLYESNKWISFAVLEDKGRREAIAFLTQPGGYDHVNLDSISGSPVHELKKLVDSGYYKDSPGQQATLLNALSKFQASTVNIPGHGEVLALARHAANADKEAPLLLQDAEIQAQVDQNGWAWVDGNRAGALRQGAIGGFLIPDSARVEDKGHAVFADNRLENVAAQELLGKRWVPSGEKLADVMLTAWAAKAKFQDLVLIRAGEGISVESVSRMMNTFGLVGKGAARAAIGEDAMVKSLPPAMFQLLAGQQGLPDVVVLSVTEKLEDAAGNTYTLVLMA